VSNPLRRKLRRLQAVARRFPTEAAYLRHNIASLRRILRCRPQRLDEKGGATCT